eukprot:3007047-Pyramimonas_sp.AAC.1
MSSCVAITRVRRRENLLIFRPFDRAPCNAGATRGERGLGRMGGGTDAKRRPVRALPAEVVGRGVREAR